MTIKFFAHVKKLLISQFLADECAIDQPSAHNFVKTDNYVSAAMRSFRSMLIGDCWNGM